MSDVATHLDDLRVAVAETEALAAVTAESYDRQDWDDADTLHIERLASLLGLISRSASRALAAFHRLHGAVADAQPAPAGERWDYDKGTSPGGEPEILDPQDAAIVRQLRERSQDGRFAEQTDAELIKLFRRNRAAMGWTEEQIIDVMTRPR